MQPVEVYICSHWLWFYHDKLVWWWHSKNLQCQSCKRWRFWWSPIIAHVNLWARIQKQLRITCYISIWPSALLFFYDILLSLYVSSDLGYLNKMLRSKITDTWKRLSDTWAIFRGNGALPYVLFIKKKFEKDPWMEVEYEEEM